MKTHPTSSAGAFSLLKFALIPKKKKMYKLGTVGDRIVTVKKCARDHVVTIRAKDDEKKSIELPQKSEFSSIFMQ